MRSGYSGDRPPGPLLGVGVIRWASGFEGVKILENMVSHHIPAPSRSVGWWSVPRGLAIVMFSGQAEYFIPLAVLTSTAVNLGMPVRIFVTGFALPYFTKKKPEPRFSKEFEDMVPHIMEGMKRTGTPSWYEMLKEAKENGDVKIYVCSLMAEIAGVKKEDLDPIVDDVVGATFFMSNIEDYEVIFI